MSATWFVRNVKQQIHWSRSEFLERRSNVPEKYFLSSVGTFKYPSLPVKNTAAPSRPCHGKQIIQKQGPDDVLARLGLDQTPRTASKRKEELLVEAIDSAQRSHTPYDDLSRRRVGLVEPSASCTDLGLRHPGCMPWGQPSFLQCTQLCP